jgi:uncharacterized membrane protein YvbJ
MIDFTKVDILIEEEIQQTKKYLEYFADVLGNNSMKDIQRGIYVRSVLRYYKDLGIIMINRGKELDPEQILSFENWKEFNK